MLSGCHPVCVSQQVSPRCCCFTVPFPASTSVAAASGIQLLADAHRITTSDNNDSKHLPAKARDVWSTSELARLQDAEGVFPELVAKPVLA